MVIARDYPRWQSEYICPPLPLSHPPVSSPLFFSLSSPLSFLPSYFLSSPLHPVFPSLSPFSSSSHPLFSFPLFSSYTNSLLSFSLSSFPPSFQPDQPVVVRGRAVKAELSDVEGLGFKLEERQKDILELKKTIKMKVKQERIRTGD